MSQHSVYKSVAIMFLAMTLIVVGDAVGKILSASGFRPLFIAWARFALGALLVLPFSGLTRAELPNLLDRHVILRACLIVGGISSILTALKTEPIANVYGGFFIGPIISYVLSAILLKEPVTIRRSILLLISFIGVLLVVKPGFGMTAGMGFAILAGSFYGAFLVATRNLAGQYRPRFLLISHLLIGAVVLTPFSIGPVPQITPILASFILISAIASAAGNFLLIVVNRTTPASVIAPLIYIQLLSATVVGALVFSDWPDYFSLIGLLVIMVAGLSSFWLAQRGK